MKDVYALPSQPTCTERGSVTLSNAYQAEAARDAALQLERAGVRMAALLNRALGGYLVVDTTNWWPGKAVLISPRSVLKTTWSGQTVDLNVTRQQIKDSPAYDGSEAVDRAYEYKFHGYYNGCRVKEPV